MSESDVSSAGSFWSNLDISLRTRVQDCSDLDLEVSDTSNTLSVQVDKAKRGVTAQLVAASTCTAIAFSCSSVWDVIKELARRRQLR